MQYNLKKLKMKKTITLFILIVLSTIASSQNRLASTSKVPNQKTVVQKVIVQKDSVAKSKTLSDLPVLVKDSIQIIKKKYKTYKKSAHASYYADKFNGKKTSSGTKFNNNKYTAAHRKLPFGTKLKITNEANGKSVVIEVTDRGPFSRGREIDLTKKAFKEIVANQNTGVMTVTIEVEDN